MMRYVISIIDTVSSRFLKAIHRGSSVFVVVNVTVLVLITVVGFPRASVVVVVSTVVVVIVVASFSCNSPLSIIKSCITPNPSMKPSAARVRAILIFLSTNATSTNIIEDMNINIESSILEHAPPPEYIVDCYCEGYGNQNNNGWSRSQT